MHNPKFREVLGKQFSPLEVQQIVDFLERGFSSNGEIAVASVFLYAITQGKQFQEIFTVCEEEWIRNWIFQHPDLKGDTSATGGVRAQNIASLFNIYRKLGISNPGA